MRIAVLVAVEDYGADDIEGVRFAGHDVQRFAQALSATPGVATSLVLLESGRATKEAVESALRDAIGSLTADDSFCLYYVGRGFTQGGKNFLSCHDTNTSAPAATSVGMEWIFGLLREAECQKLVVFFDSCHRGALGRDESSHGHVGRADGELEEFFGAAPDRVCFAPCLAHQVSWGSRRNRHGAWALSIIDAFSGDASAALQGGTLLTSGSLQDYLEPAVQKVLRGDFVERRDQTPWASGSVSDELLLAEFGGALSPQKAAVEPQVAQVPRLVLCSEARQPIKKLSGFKKHQRVPSDLSRHGEGLVREAAAQEIVDDLEAVYRRLRDEFDLRRKDLEKVGPEDGGGSIVCPFFTYHVSVAQDPDNPASALFHREIGDISEPERLLDHAFQGVFGGVFGSLRFTPPVQIDLDGFIDRMEDIGEDLQALDYDPAGSHCSLRLRGVDARIKVTATDILLVHDRSKEPRVLIETFSASQRFLVEANDVRLLSFD